MKKTILYILFAFIGLTESQAQNRDIKVTVNNPSDADRHNEPVAVKLKDVKKLTFDVKKAEVRDAASGKKVQVQLDDMDGDRRTDEIFWLADVKAGETKTYMLSLKGKDDASGECDGEKHTNADDGKWTYTALQLRDKADKHPDVLKVEAPGKSNVFNDIYMHGMTVESDMVGYRIYFDHRQNIDLYGKRKRRIELPVTQFYTTAEQLNEGYGVDVLWAGGAIGCGTLKNWTQGKPGNWTDVEVRGQRVVTSGALRTVVEMYDLGAADGNGGRFDMWQRYTLCAHHRDMLVEVTTRDAANKVLCTGVQKVGTAAADSVKRGHESVGSVKENGLAVSWGCDYPDMGKKSIWAPVAVGLAVWVPQRYVVGTEEDELNYLVKMKSDENGKLKYWLSFCAEIEDDGPKSGEEWIREANIWKRMLENEVVIKIR